MGDSEYSFSLTTFAPSGKLLQIEYALNVRFLLDRNLLRDRLWMIFVIVDAVGVVGVVPVGAAIIVVVLYGSYLQSCRD